MSDKINDPLNRPFIPHKFSRVKTIEVTVKSTGERAIINESDYDSNLYGREHSPTDGADIVSIGNLTAKQAVKLIQAATTNEELDSLQEEENDGRERVTVLKAIERQREYLETEDEEEENDEE